jgi:hypothetical protein
VLDQATAPTVSHVSAEHRGQARAFRNAVKLVDVAFDAALDIIAAPLRARLQRHPKLRAEMLPDVARQYDQLIPSQYRIGKIDGAKHKTEFAIRERRICVSWLKHDEWDPEQHEPGVSICKFTFSMHQGRLRTRWTPLINVSLHALARRVERHHDRSHEALLRDVAQLADTGDIAGDRIDTPNGWWLGSVINAADEHGRTIRMRNVRTWISR